MYTQAKNGCYDELSLEEDDQLAQVRNFISNQERTNEQYKIVAHYNYPLKRETRSRSEIIFDEANYYVSMLASSSEEWSEGRPAKIEVSCILSFEKIKAQDCDESELADILSTNGYEVKENKEGVLFVHVPYFDSQADDSTENEDDTGKSTFKVYTQSKVPNNKH